MASKTFKDDKHVKTFSVAIETEIAHFGHVRSKEERRAQRKEELDGYYAIQTRIDELIEKAKKDPKDESVKKALGELRAEREAYVSSHPDVRAHLEYWAEEKRKASIKRQAEKIVAEKRNADAMAYLEKVRAEKKAKDKALQPKKANNNQKPVNGINAKQRALNLRMEKVKEAEEKKAQKEKIDKVESQKGHLEDLVAEVNKAIGGYGF